MCVFRWMLSRCVADGGSHGESQRCSNLSSWRCDWSSGTEGGSQAGQRPIGPTVGKMAPSDVLCLWWAAEKGGGRSSVGRGRGVWGERWCGGRIGELWGWAIFGPYMTHIPPGFRWVQCNRFLFPIVRGCGEVEQGGCEAQQSASCRKHSCLFHHKPSRARLAICNTNLTFVKSHSNWKGGTRVKSGQFFLGLIGSKLESLSMCFIKIC